MSTEAYRAAHRDEIAVRQAAHYVAHREEVLARQAAYRAANRDRIAAKKADWYAAQRPGGSGRDCQSSLAPPGRRQPIT